MIKMTGRLLAMVAVATVILAQAGPASARTTRAKIGLLNCTMAPSIGLIIGSRQRLDCRFESRQGFVERYSGTVSRLGLDLGFTAGGRMLWAVSARTKGPKRGALSGTYVGASADIALGLGVGANALIGGSNRSIALQPLSVSGQGGVNLALGVASLQLRLAN